MAFDYDLFVIGAGSGGTRAARIAASHGAKVAVAEEFRIGGTCVIRGCVPKKVLVYASRFADSFADAAAFGWSIGEPRLSAASTPSVSPMTISHAMPHTISCSEGPSRENSSRLTSVRCTYECPRSPCSSFSR